MDAFERDLSAIDWSLATENKRQFSDYLKDSNQNSFFMKPTIAEEVKNIIMTLMSSKSTGPNNVPTFLRKQTRNTVSLPLAKVINTFFKTGIFPDICKVAKVVPVFKSETRLLCNNYRPISLLSNIGKINEKLMHQRLKFFLEQYNCYYSFQFGFRLNYSTNNALMSIVENIQTQLDNGEFAAGVSVDLRKAFDTVDHRILIRKLEHYGVRCISEKWFSSYLTNRKQFVSIDNRNSTTKTILTGVQYSKSYHFADDTNTLQSGKSLEVLAKKLNQDLKD